MSKVVERQRTTLKEMVERKKKVVEYLSTGDESKRPEGIRFVDPFDLPGTKKRGGEWGCCKDFYNRSRL